MTAKNAEYGMFEIKKLTDTKIIVTTPCICSPVVLFLAAYTSNHTDVTKIMRNGPNRMRRAK